MVENRPFRTILTHAILIMGIVVIIFPIYIALVASTHKRNDIATTVQKCQQEKNQYEWLH